MSHTYQSVSDITPDGSVEDQFTWNNINTNYDTWLELLAKEHWCDWYFGTAFIDAWTSLTRADRTYKEVTK